MGPSALRRRGPQLSSWIPFCGGGHKALEGEEMGVPGPGGAGQRSPQGSFLRWVLCPSTLGGPLWHCGMEVLVCPQGSTLESRGCPCPGGSPLALGVEWGDPWSGGSLWPCGERRGSPAFPRRVEIHDYP